MSFQQGLSGLNAASKNLDVIGNNVANAATSGFKSGQAQFADVFAASLSGSGSSPVGIGTKVGAITQQFSQGNITTTNNPLDVAINGGAFFIARKDGETSYTRNGQFQLDKDGFVVTNAGYKIAGYQASSTTGGIIPTLTDLLIPKDPIAPSPTGATLAGVQGNLNFNSAEVVPSVSPFNFADPLSYNNTTSITIYDNTGASSTYSMYFVKTQPNTWDVYSVLTNSVGDATPLGNTSVTGGSISAPIINSANLLILTTAAGGALSAITIANTNTSTLRANKSGVTAYTTPSGAVTITGGIVGALTNGTYYPITGASLSIVNASGTVNPLNFTSADVRIDKNTGDMTIVTQTGGPVKIDTITFTTAGVLSSGTVPYTESIPTAILASAGSALTFDVSFSGTTQYAGAFGVNTLTQDGYGRGLPAGFNVGADGVITGRYTNGQTKSLGQFLLARFPNTQGLQPIGNNLWNESSSSGSRVEGTPGASGDFGLLQNAATEDSNVDLTAELVNMITAQRVYQANAQTIKTLDTTLQTLINLR